MQWVLGIVHRPPWGAKAWFHHILHSKNIPKNTSSIVCWDFSVHFYLKQFFSVLWSSWYLSCTSRYSVPGFCQVTRTYGSMFTNFASKVMSGYGNHGTIWQYRNATNQVVNFFSFLGSWTLDLCHHSPGDDLSNILAVIWFELCGSGCLRSVLCIPSHQISTWFWSVLWLVMSSRSRWTQEEHWGFSSIELLFPLAISNYAKWVFPESVLPILKHTAQWHQGTFLLCNSFTIISRTVYAETELCTHQTITLFSPLLSLADTTLFSVPDFLFCSCLTVYVRISSRLGLHTIPVSSCSHWFVDAWAAPAF